MNRSPKKSMVEDQEEARRKLAWRNGDANSPPSSTPRKSSSRTPRKHQMSWRIDESELPEKENRPSISSPPRSQGLAPDTFHRKYFSDPRHQQISDKLKQTVENSLLSQEKIKYQQTLEAQRKAFRKETSMERWPLQGMAMEDLDYLLQGQGKEGFIPQIHGGEDVSGESSSSAGSADHGGKRRHVPEASSPSRILDYSLQDDDLKEAVSSVLESTKALWSREPRIFATEKAQGKRKYIVGHFGRIADWYWRKCVNKHLYEVIREKTPCRLYFDLEFSKKFNPNVDEKALLEEFYQELRADFQEHLNIVLEKKQIVDLDSSTEEKFSRHWIINVDHDGLFEDAVTVGRFVKRLVSRLSEEHGIDQLQGRRPTLAQHLFVKTKDARKPSCFVDLGVYTRNRLFRCYASSKFGKTNVLKVAESNQHSLASLPESSHNTKEKDGESPRDANARTTTLEEYVTANNWEPHAENLAKTLVVPLGGSKGKRIFKVDEDESAMKFAGSQESSSTKHYKPAVSIYSSKPPLPSLEKYVAEVLGRRGGTQGAIRAWSLEYGGPRGDIPMGITFQMCRNRHCELIGRPHKSNNIFWTIVFDSWTCLQGCHDPECFGRGAPVPIPDDYLNTIKAEFQRWRDEEFEKALSALNLDDLPPSTTTIELSAATKIENSGTCHPSFQKSELSNSTKTAGSSLLSDEALLEAIEANPELFP